LVKRDPEGSAEGPSDEDSDESINGGVAHRIEAMDQYLVADARPPHVSPRVTVAAEQVRPFVAVQVVDDHPFASNESLIILLTADGYCDTEVLRTLIERQYTSEEEISCMPRQVGEVLVTKTKGIEIFCAIVKPHIDSKPLRIDLRTCLKTLKNLLVKKKVKIIGIVRDLAMLSVTDWAHLIDQTNRIFKGIEISIVFFKK